MDQIKALIDDVIIDFTRVFKADTPFQKHKMAVLIGYLVISVFTIGWSLSGGEEQLNDLGARVELNVVELSGERWIMIINESDDDWEKIRITADNELFYHPDVEELAAGESLKVFAKDFRATVYIPRAVRLSGPEATTHPPQASVAPADHPFQSIHLKTEDAEYRHTFASSGKKAESDPEEAPPTEEEKVDEEKAEE